MISSRPTRRLILAALALGFPARAASAAAPLAEAGLPAGVKLVKARGGIEQYRLASNGMDILLLPSHAAPVVTFLVVVRVGSRNEAPGNTGSAHLLEHMLFNKSTENFGRAKGKTIQAVLYEAGGDFSTSNMTTWDDRITMYDTLPADRLETTMKINADRLRRGLILDSERKPEMTVVRNEYERGENDPGQALQKAVNSAAIVAHPYHWDAIGWKSDIEGVSTEQLRRHYDTFFWPDNATAVLVGDFDKAAALAMFDREFGGFPKAPAPIPQVVTTEPPQEGERRVIVRRAGAVPLVSLAWLRPGARDPQFYAFDVLATILGSGISSRLYQGLVETRLATSVSADNWAFRDPYLLVVNATVAQGDGATVAQGDGADAAQGGAGAGDAVSKVERGMREVVSAIREKGVTAEEMARAKALIEAQVALSRDGTYGTAATLGEAIAASDWEWWIDYLDRIRAVTADDVKSAATKYLGPDQVTVGTFLPKTEDAGGGAGKAAGASGGAKASRGTGTWGRAETPEEAGAWGRPGASRGAEASGAARASSARFARNPAKAWDGTDSIAEIAESAPDGAAGGEPAAAGASGAAASAAAPVAGAAAGAAAAGPAGPIGATATGPAGAIGATAAGPAGPAGAAAAASAAGKGGPAGSGFAQRTRRVVLPNGAVVLLLPNALSDTVSVRVRVRAGSFLDADRPGLAEAVAGMLSRGTAKRSKIQIARDLESVGSTLSWDIDRYDVVGRGACLAKNLPALLGTILEEMATPSFPQDEIVKLEEEMKAGILEEENSTSSRAVEALARTLYPEGHPLRAHTAAERLAALPKIGRDDLARFHERHYGGSSMVIALCGRFDAATLEKDLTRLFSALPRGAAAPVDAARVTNASAKRVVVAMQDKANVDIVIGAAGGLRRKDPDYYAAYLANAVLGQSSLSSRLGAQVRDTEGLTYVIVSRFLSADLLDGPWAVFLSVAPDNVEPGLASTMRVVRTFASEGVRQEELAVEKSAAAGRFQVALSNNNGIAEALALAESAGLGVSLLDEYPRKIRAVTLADVNRAIKAHIDSDRLVTVIAGSVKQ